MMNEKNQRSDDIVTAKKAALKEAFRRADEIELTSIPDEDSIEWEFSPRFEQKMQRLLHQQPPRQSRRILRISRPRLAAACVAVCLLVVCLMSVSATKTPVSNLILTPQKNQNYEVTMKEEYTLPDGSTAIAPEEIETWYMPSYIPKDYTLEYVSADITGTRMYWEREDGEKIRFDQDTASSSPTIDALNASVSTVTIADGHEGTLIKNKSGCKLLWDNHGYMFSIFYPTDIPDEQGIKIAESLTAHSMEEINALKKE